jgi:hypothetical protein
MQIPKARVTILPIFLRFLKIIAFFNASNRQRRARGQKIYKILNL